MLDSARDLLREPPDDIERGFDETQGNVRNTRAADEARATAS